MCCVLSNVKTVETIDPRISALEKGGEVAGLLSTTFAGNKEYKA